jgi:multiple antibiotic resistance protein
MNSFVNVKFFWEVFVTLLMITDPPGIVPVFVGMTAGRPAAERHRLAWQAADPVKLERNKANVAFVPLGPLLLAVAGTIVATTLLVRRTRGSGDIVAFAVAIGAVVVLLWLAMRFSGAIHRVLRDSGVEMLTRIVGSLLSAVAG